MIDEAQIDKLSDPNEVAHLLEEYTALLEHDLDALSPAKGVGVTLGAGLGFVLGLFAGPIGAIAGATLMRRLRAGHLAKLVAKASQMREHAAKRIENMPEFDHRLAKAEFVLRRYRQARLDAGSEIDVVRPSKTG